MPEPAASPRAVIADDERLLRDQLRARLGEVWPELEIVGEAKNGIEAVQLTEQLHPDLVFLDIRMPGMSGVEAARAIAQLPVAEAGGEAGGRGRRLAGLRDRLHHRLRPVRDRGLRAGRRRLRAEAGRARAPAADRRADQEAPGAAALRRRRAGTAGLQQLLQKLATQVHPNAAPRLKWIQATVGQSIQMIPVEDVLFFISDEKYTRVQTASVEALIRKPIKELVDEVDADLFWQIHRSTLVNTRHIAGVTRDLRGRQLVSVKGHPEKLEVSRSYAGLFKGM